MDFEDPRLKKILKLKEEFEKELIKMGKLKPKVKESVKKSLSVKIDISPPANVSAPKTWTVIDVNAQDYDATDSSVVKALRQSLGKVGDIRQRTIVSGIIKLLQGELKEAKEIFSRFDSDEFKYMLGITKLYMGDPDVIEYAVDYIKRRPSSKYPYLLMAEIMIGMGRFLDAVRFMEAAKKQSNDVFLELTLGVYRGDDSVRKLFPIAVNKNAFKSFLAILSMFMEKGSDRSKKIADTFRSREHACCRYVASYWGRNVRKDDPEKYPFCPRINLIHWAKSFDEGRMDFDPEEKVTWNDPLSELFLGFYHFNNGNHDKADEHFAKFKNSVEITRIYTYRCAEGVRKIGMRMIYEARLPDPLTPIDDLKSSSIESALKNSKVERAHLDVYVDFKDPEILRLFFGQRHCKNLY